jgi:hypothetical protein
VRFNKDSNLSASTFVLYFGLVPGTGAMAIMIYHHRRLVSTAGFDQVSGKWKYAATVSWSEIGSITRFHFVATSPELFDGFEEAEKAGLQAANPG